MKEVFRVLYRGNPKYNFGIGVVYFFAGILFCIMGLLFVLYGANVGSIVIALVLGCGFFTGSGVLIILPFNAVRRFKKEFGFLPPTTSEERDAKQRVVDCRLSWAADSYSNCDMTERGAREKLKSFSGGKGGDVSIDCYLIMVDECKNSLCLAKENMSAAKRHFWNLHAIVSSSYLPQPFKVLEKRDDYKNVTFENPAKHKKDEKSDQLWRKYGGRY